MTVRYVEQHDPRYALTRRFWLVDVDVLGGDGRRRRLRRVAPGATRRGAEDLERRLRIELLSPQEVEVPTFGEFVEIRWWPTYPSAAGNRPATVREKAIHLRTHLIPAFGQLPLDRVGGETVDRFVATLRTSGRALKTIANILTTLRTILNSAVSWKVLPVMPELRRIRTPPPSFSFYSFEEARRLIAAATDPHEQALLLFALTTGARAGEELAVRWTDLEGSAVVFRRSRTRGVEGPPKSGRARAVPVSAALAEALCAIRHERGPCVFCDQEGRPLHLPDLHRALDHAAARAQVRRLRWHDLRHTFASSCVLRGIPLRQVQLWLGHSSIALTERYAHVAPHPELAPEPTSDTPFWLVTPACVVNLVDMGSALGHRVGVAGPRAQGARDPAEDLRGAVRREDRGNDVADGREEELRDDAHPRIVRRQLGR
jgi:integrase